jgi:kynurenine formamidase
MKPPRPPAVVLIFAAVLFGGSLSAQSWLPPPDSQRCPSKWGAGDQRGSGNLMKPESVLRASRLIKTGEAIELSHVLEASMPLSAGRRFEVITKRTDAAVGANKRGGNEEVIVAEMGQVGTQFDGFSHQTVGNSLYNCFKVDEISTRTGFTKLGIENVGFLMTRGVLIDIAALKGVPILPKTYEITVADIEAALKRENITVQPGDALIFYTGWGRNWDKGTAGYGTGNPGIGVAAGQWVVKQNPMLIGADTPPVEVSPNPDKTISLPIHQMMLAVYGIHLLENLKLDELAAKKIYEFALMVEPLKLKGATGSTVAPVAVR